MNIELFLVKTALTIIVILWVVIRLAKCLNSDQNCIIKTLIKKLIDKA